MQHRASSKGPLKLIPISRFVFCGFYTHRPKFKFGCRPIGLFSLFDFPLIKYKEFSSVTWHCQGAARFRDLCLGTLRLPRSTWTRLKVRTFIKIIALAQSAQGVPDPKATEDFNDYMLRSDTLTAVDAKKVKKVLRKLDQLRVTQRGRQHSVTGDITSKLQGQAKTQPTRTAPTGVVQQRSNARGRGQGRYGQGNPSGLTGRGASTGRGQTKFSKRISPWDWDRVCPANERRPGCNCNHGSNGLIF